MSPPKAEKRSLKGEVGSLKEGHSFLMPDFQRCLDFLSFRSRLKRAVRDRFRARCCTEFGSRKSVLALVQTLVTAPNYPPTLEALRVYFHNIAYVVQLGRSFLSQPTIASICKFSMSTIAKLGGNDFDRMVQRGAFVDLGPLKVELINGDLRFMNPAGPVHDAEIEFLTNWSYEHTNREQISIRVQSGIECGDHRQNQILFGLGKLRANEFARPKMIFF